MVLGRFTYTCSRLGDVKMWEVSSFGSNPLGALLGTHDLAPEKGLHLGTQRHFELGVCEDRLYTTHDGTFMSWQ